MLGTFSPQIEPYTQIMEEETTPAGVLARGAYTAKTKVSFRREVTRVHTRSGSLPIVLDFNVGTSVRAGGTCIALNKLCN